MYIAPKGKTHNLLLSETGFCANIFATKTVVEPIPIFTSGDYTTDVTATNLRKYQWDYIHNPENIVGIFEDDSEGEMKGTTSTEKVVNVIEMIRCAYKTDRKVKFEKDTWKWFSETVSVTDFTELYDNQTYEYIFVELLDDVDAIEIPANLTYQTDDNYLAEVFMGEVVKFDLGTLIIKVDKNHGQALYNYLKPTESEFVSQKKQFIQKIVEKYEQKKYSRAKVIDLLSVSSQCLFEYLTQEQRIALLKLINDGSNIPETVERIVINIIRTTPEGQINYVLENLYYEGLMAYFDKVINDVGGKNYYTRLIIELLKLYTKENSSELENCFSTTDWGDIFIKVTTPFFEWEKDCDVPTWRYGNKGLVIENHNTCGYYNDAKKVLNPFEPIVVYIAEELPFFNLGDNFEDRVIAMPAFVLSWLRYKAIAYSGTELLNDGVIIATSCLILGQGGLVAKGAPKVLLTAWNYLLKIDAAMKLLLVNDEIEIAIRNLGANGEGDKFLNTYKEFSPYFGYLGKPAIERVLFKQNIDDLILGFVSMGACWDVIKTSDEVKNTLSDTKINEITTNIDNAKKALNNEEIVE